MTQNSIVEKLTVILKKHFADAEAGHDYWHALRVCNTAEYISKIEGGNLQTIQLAALLHDVADPKFHNGDEQKALDITKEMLASQQLDAQSIEEICAIISRISFKGGFTDAGNTSLELRIVQDADRLDALGAIGIARTFHYGGYKNRELYNPDVPVQTYANSDEYRASTSPTINHFYEKLLLLKDMMNTKTATSLAQERHDFLCEFLEHFYKEWNV